MRPLRILAWLPPVALLAACSVSSPQAATSPPTTPTDPGTSTSTPAPGSTTLETTTFSDTGTASSTTSEPVSESSSTTGVVIGQPTSDSQNLTLADAFNAPQWEEASRQPAGKRDSIQAISQMVYCGNNASLEYRFAESTGTLKFTAMQGMASQSSTNTLAFSILADGRTVQAKNVTFKQQAELSAPLSGVAVINIVVEGTRDRACENSAEALITKLRVIR